MKMRTAALGLVAIATVTGAMAQTFSATFPSDSSTVVSSTGALSATSIGYFWSVARGDMVEETYVGTGLASVVQLDLELEVVENVLSGGSQVDWDVRVNGNSVGSFSVAEGYLGAISESFAFAAIAGAGTYTVGIHVSNEVAPGFGSIALEKNADSTMTLHAVPEPASMAALGLGALALIRRRRSK